MSVECTLILYHSRLEITDVIATDANFELALGNSKIANTRNAKAKLQVRFFLQTGAYYVRFAFCNFSNLGDDPRIV